jgi:hypothetical protein
LICIAQLVLLQIRRPTDEDCPKQNLTHGFLDLTSKDFNEQRLLPTPFEKKDSRPTARGTLGSDGFSTRVVSMRGDAKAWKAEKIMAKQKSWRGMIVDVIAKRSVPSRQGRSSTTPQSQNSGTLGVPLS